MGSPATKLAANPELAEIDNNNNAAVIAIKAIT